MKSLYYVLVLLLCFTSCRKKIVCPDIYPTLITDKPRYKQFEPVRFKVLYTERASYTWLYNGTKIGEGTDELFLSKASDYKDGTVSCIATVGNCIQKMDHWLICDSVTLPSCNLNINSITIDNTEMKISNVVFDKSTATLHGNITGIGASTNDNITIVLPKVFNSNDPVNIFYLSHPYNYPGEIDLADMIFTYGNLQFITRDNHEKLLYTRNAHGGTLSSCNFQLFNFDFPTYNPSGKFSVDFTF